jgi:hypothetical protein
MFLGIFGRRIPLNDTEVESVEESVALQDNFPETEGPLNSHFPALRGTQLNEYSVNSFLIKYHSSH